MLGKPLAAAIVLLVLAVLAVGLWTFFDGYHFAVVRQGVLYRDGVRSARQFRVALRRSGARTVVSLVDDAEFSRQPFTDEQACCRQRHVDLVRIPIQLGGWPTAGQVKEFLAIVNDPARQPVLVHCAQGVRRTGMMVAAYERSVLGMTPEQTEAAIQTFGHSERSIGDIRTFIRAYDPSTGSVPATMPISQE